MCLQRKMGNNKLDELIKEDTCDDTSTCVNVQLHGSDFSIDFLHEMNDEVNKLNLLQILEVEIGNKERDVVIFARSTTKNLEFFSTHCKETRELINKDSLKSVSLLNLNRNTDRVNGRFNQALLIAITGDNNRLKEKLFAHSAEKNMEREWKQRSQRLSPQVV